MPHSTKKLNNRKKQAGFTLIEMMVSAVIGLAIMAGTLSFFVNSTINNSNTLKELHLNQELRALMDVMVRDIRRAGYWRKADGKIVNIYNTHLHKLSVTNGNCVTYSYDDYQAANSNPDIVQNSDAAGFRLVDNVVKFRKKSSLCDTTKNWEAISDISTVKVTKLRFSVNGICENISSPRTPTNEQRGCLETGGPNQILPPLLGDTLVTMNIVNIVLSGELVSDPGVSLANITENVTVRNSVLF